MKKILVVGLMLLGSKALAQGWYPTGDEQVRSQMSSSMRADDEFRGRSDLSLVSGISGFEIDGVARQGYNIDLRATVERISRLRIELNAGVVFYNSSVDSQTPSAEYGGYYGDTSPYGFNDYSAPRFDLRFGLGYFGPEAIYYFSDGKVRPYIGAGIEAVTWQMNRGFAASLAPTARGGVEVAVSRSFAGFVEARYMAGFPNVINGYSTSLRYVTSVAFGVSFAPQL